jgi:PAS domain S-box-containing protein
VADNGNAERRERARSKKTRPTIGLITDWLEGRYQSLVWPGVADVAEERDANLICFLGEALRPQYGFEARSNVIYDLVSAEAVDALVILTGSIRPYMSREEFRDFCERYRPLPMVSVSLALEGIPSVLVDNDVGLRDEIAHLIEDHGYRRIAFIRGPAGHQEAEQRYRIYTEVLSEHGLPLDPELVAPGDFTIGKGEEAIRLLLDEREVDLEAVVAANDDMALGVLDALRERGLRVPDDMALVGFDDAEDAKYATPALTTVQQPLYKLGRQAAEMALALLAGDEVPEQVVLPTELVIRQSCGCLNPAVARAAAGPVRATRKSLRAVLAAQRKEIVSEIVRAVGTPSLGQELVACWVEELLDGLSADLKNERAQGVFLQALDRILRQVMEEGGDVAAWQGAISTLRRHALACPTSQRVSSRIDDLWQQARVLIGDTSQWAQGRRLVQASRRAEGLRRIGSALTAPLDVKELMKTAARELVQLGIRRVYLSLYEGKETPHEWSRLVLAYDERGDIELGTDGRRFPSRQLTPDGMLPQDERSAILVAPLSFGKDQLGFVLFEIGPRDEVVYETLRAQLSSALKGALILEERRRGEEALARERNLLHTLINNLPDYIYVKDAEGRFLLGNAAVLRQMGLTTLDELVGRTDFDFFSQELAARYYAEEQAIIQSGRPLLDYEGSTVDAGGERWVSTNKVPLRDAQGKVTGFVALGRDITERKAAEAERERLLAQLERRALQLQTAAEVSRAASGILDLDSLIQQAVDLIRERFNLYYVGLFLVDQTGEWSGEPNRWAVLRAGSCEAGRAMLEQGHRLEIGGRSVIGRCVADHQPQLSRDVPQEKVRSANPWFPETQSEIALPLTVGEQVLGALSVQSPMPDRFTPEMVSVLTTLAAQLAVAVQNAWLHGAVKVHAEELEAAYRSLQENQAKLLISDKMASLGRLTAGIAHEMNTPLAAVRAALHRMQELAQEYQDSIGHPQVMLDDHRAIAREMHGSVSLAVGAAERAAEFVRSIRSSTRDLAPLKRERFNALPVIQEALLLLSYPLRQGGCTVNFEPAGQVVEMIGSPSRLVQIIANLVTNSIDAMADRGGGSVTLGLTHEQGCVVLTVADTGCGIPPENLTRIFDPMFTTKPFGQGTGLGLTIVHDIVTGDFGGRIEVASQPGQGTTFTLYFPDSMESPDATPIAD